MAGTSRIDFTPEQTTSAPSARASSSRSAETSKVRPAPRWTPPRPPVARTSSPCRRASQSVAPTVDAASRPRATAHARSRRPAFRTGPRPGRASRSSSSGPSPTRTDPPSTAIVAGSAPASRTAASEARAVARLSGQGRPWVISVDSRATLAGADSVIRASPIPDGFRGRPPVRVGLRLRTLGGTLGSTQGPPGRDDASDLGCGPRPPQGRVVRLRPPRHVHRGAFAVRPLRNAGGFGAVARPLPDRGQPAAVRGPRPGEHQRHVRQRRAGRAGPAQERRPDRGRPERLRHPDRRGGPGRAVVGAEDDGLRRLGPPGDPLRRLRRPGAAGRRGRGRRPRGSATSAGARPPPPPSPSPTTRSSASWAGARWGSSTRPGTARPAGWSP